MALLVHASPRPRVSASLSQARRGFTMIELLVVVGIVVLLLAILLPVVNQVRKKAFVAQTEAEMVASCSTCINS